MTSEGIVTYAPDEAAGRGAALAYVCEHLEQIRSDLRQGATGDDDLLEQLLAAVREGRDLAGLLDQLHQRLQAEGDAAGIYGAITRDLRPIGVPSDAPAETVYVCPLAARCLRYWLPQAHGPRPRCEISGQLLRRERL